MAESFLKDNNMKEYVHGYSQREAERLRDQSVILLNLLQADTSYAAGSKILEAGCGVGAQTVILARKSPQAEFISIDISRDSLNRAKEMIDNEGISNVSFQQGNIFDTAFKTESFDHIFVCFVLEHLEDPSSALVELKRVLKQGGTITVIEGDHGSCFWHPETEESLKVWHSLIKAQINLNHDPLIGRQLYPLLTQAGFKVKDISPIWVYADSNNSELLDGVVNKIIVPMTETAKEQSLKLKLIDESTWNKGIYDLQITGMPPNGTFFYTWFKGLAIK